MSPVSIAMRALSAPGAPSRSANGSSPAAPGFTETTAAPIADRSGAYSPSGSMTSTRCPASSARASSTFTRYDFPAPLVANTTALWFSREKRSRTTGLRVAVFTP